MLCQLNSAKFFERMMRSKEGQVRCVSVSLVCKVTVILLIEQKVPIGGRKILIRVPLEFRKA